MMNETAFWAMINTIAVRYGNDRIQEVINDPIIREIILIDLFDEAFSRIANALSTQSLAYCNQNRSFWLYNMSKSV